MADQVEQVEEVSIESVASNLSNDPAALNTNADKLRSIKKNQQKTKQRAGSRF